MAMALFRKRYHPPGTSPGTLTGEVAAAAPAIRVTDYTDADYFDKELATPAECRPFLARASKTWIHVQGGVGPDTLRALGDLFGLHHLALEDVLNTGQRPKVEAYDGLLFVVMNLPGNGAGGPACDTACEQVSIFVGEGFVVSFHDGLADPFEPVRHRLRQRIGRIRSRQVDYLLYAMLDVVIDQAFPVLERLGEVIEDLEEELLESPDKATLARIYAMKRSLVVLRRMLWPQREVINQLLRDDYELITDETKLYLRDCYDHTVHVLDLLETYRETTTGMLDVYLSSVSNRLNDIMRVLTMIATIFIPLTFIAGLYGMNFGINTRSPWAMPELEWYYGYPLVWLLMIVIAAGMVIYFRRKRWL